MNKSDKLAIMSALDNKPELRQNLRIDQLAKSQLALAIGKPIEFINAHINLICTL